MTRRAGRPTKLTNNLEKAITTALSQGIPFGTACQMAGIHQDSGYEWLKRGEREKGGPHATIYAKFSDAVMRARARDEVRRLKRITAAARGGAVIYRKTTTFADGRVIVEERHREPDWDADAWVLERSRPDAWGRRERVDVHHFVLTEIERIKQDMDLTEDEKNALIADVEAFAYGRA